MVSVQLCGLEKRMMQQIRDKWTVDRSSLGIAFYNGAKDGTCVTIEYKIITDHCK